MQALFGVRFAKKSFCGTLFKLTFSEPLNVKNSIKRYIFIIGFLFLLFIIFVPSYSKIQDFKKKNEKYQLQLDSLVQEKIKMDEERRLLREDSDYLEKVARDKMSIGREGEVIYRIKKHNKE